MKRRPSAADALSIDSLARLAPETPVCLAGRFVWIDGQSARLDDASGSIAVALEANDAPALGAWAYVTGKWDGARVLAEHVEVVHEPTSAFPQVRGDWVRFHDDGRAAIRALEQRALVMRAVRGWFEGERFLEVETPAAVPCPGLDLHLDAFGLANAGSPRWLATSPEYQMKRLLVAGLPRIFQLARCFRRGELGSRHQPEFTMLEWYRSFAGAAEVIRDTEELVASVARATLGTTSLEGGLELAPPWRRVTVEDALREHAQLELDEVLPDEERFFLAWTEHVEPRLGWDRPCFVVEWPASMASLARLLPERPDRADRFEAYVRGVELCNGFGELTDPREQRTRLERDQRNRQARGLPVYPLDERFLAALEEGMPPSGGNALGIDRLVMLLLGRERIDDVLAFPDQRL